ncbi:hypothetical protein GCWU000342_00670 [Shuttleworthella satelles DSM 14600]|uniref:Uncharacterized protein n=1 Tax=Shuttleworthella satelles DSM 14600 TaxID=626523 RepID=C4G9L7_9FIRM|nr:hypothetical protein GCWU000342_00670 [Shuttleworthia satelles DSM 14600]
MAAIEISYRERRLLFFPLLDKDPPPLYDSLRVYFADLDIRFSTSLICVTGSAIE